MITRTQCSSAVQPLVRPLKRAELISPALPAFDVSRVLASDDRERKTAETSCFDERTLPASGTSRSGVLRYITALRH